MFCRVTRPRRRERRPSLSDENRESLAIIQRSGEHLLWLINDVLSIAKIEAGKITLVDEPFDLARLLQTVRTMTSARAEAKGLDLVVEIDSDLPAVVRTWREDEAYCLAVTAPHETLPALLERFRAEGRELTRLGTRHASLEDVFVTLTGRHLRDGKE